MRNVFSNRGVTVALLGVIVFDCIVVAAGLATMHPLSWVPVALANVIMIEVAVVATSSPEGENAHIFGAALATGAFYADVLAVILAVAFVLLDAHPLICVAVYLVLAYIIWTGTATVENVAEDIETKQVVAKAERRVIQMLQGRMSALLAGERDMNRRRVLSRANDALLSCPTRSREDVAPYEDAIEQSLTRLEQLERSGASIDALTEEVRALSAACVSRNQMLKVK